MVWTTVPIKPLVHWVGLKFLDWFPYDSNRRHETVNYIVLRIKNYTNLIYANQLKTRFADQSLAWSRNKRHDRIQKAQKA